MRLALGHPAGGGGQGSGMGSDIGAELRGSGAGAWLASEMWGQKGPLQGLPPCVAWALDILAGGGQRPLLSALPLPALLQRQSPPWRHRGWDLEQRPWGCSEPDSGVPCGKAAAAACLPVSHPRAELGSRGLARPQLTSVWLQAAGRASSSAGTRARRWSARASWATSCWPTASPVKVTPRLRDGQQAAAPGPLLLPTSGQGPLCSSGPFMGNSPGPASQLLGICTTCRRT